MHTIDIIILTVVAALLLLALRSTLRHYGGKGGGCGCSGGCAGCSGSCSAAPAGHSGQPATSKASKTFPVRGMKCDNCRRAVEQALIAVPGVTMVNVDAKTGRATVTTNGTVTDAQLAGAVTAAGYTAEL